MLEAQSTVMNLERLFQKQKLAFLAQLSQFGSFHEII